MKNTCDNTLKSLPNEVLPALGILHVGQFQFGNITMGAEPPQAAEFLQKRLISEFFGFQWQNLAEILSLFLGGHFGSFLAHFRSFGAI